MLEFTGKKFFPTGRQTFTGKYDREHQPIYKDEFQMTRSYRSFLVDKERHRLETEVVVIKTRIEYSQKHYDYTDPVDLSELQNALYELNTFMTKNYRR